MSESSSVTSLAEEPEVLTAEKPSSPSLGSEQLTTRGRMGKVAGVRVLATGSYVPETIVTNEDLAELGCDLSLIHI